MSSPVRKSDRSDRKALKRLDGVVDRALSQIGKLETGLQSAVEGVERAEHLLADFRAGSEDPVQMKTRLDRLEVENEDMRERLEAGRASVERLIARIRFLEEQR